MRKSPDKTSAGTRKLISYLFAGLMAFMQAGDIDIESDSNDTIECESCKETRKKMLEKFRKIKESAPKKAEPSQAEDDNNQLKHLDLSDCDDCEFA